MPALVSSRPGGRSPSSTVNVNGAEPAERGEIREVCGSARALLERRGRDDDRIRIDDDDRELEHARTIVVVRRADHDR